MASFADGLRQALGLLFPVYARPGDLGGLGRQSRIVIHSLVIGFLLAVLAWVGRQHVPRVLAPAPGEAQSFRLSEFWLVGVGWIVYALGWLGWTLRERLGLTAPGKQFQDIDLAWDEATRSLRKAGIRLSDMPVFLVLGQPASTETALFDAARLELVVRQAPAHADSPIHVYVFRDGSFDSVFITCPGASLLGRQAAILAGRADSGMPEDADRAGTLGTDEIFASGQSGVTDEVADSAILLGDAALQGRYPDQLTEEELHRLNKVKRLAMPPLLRNQPLTAELTAKLQYLCRLIRRERRPLNPINGVLVLLPYAAADSKQDAEQTSLVCELDLAAVQTALQLHCPCFALLCDLEKAPGFREFVARNPEEWRQRRLGQGLPLVPDLAAEQMPEVIGGVVRWFCRALFPSWIYKRFHVEAQALPGNIRLYQLMRDMHVREPFLSHLVTRGFLGPHGTPVWLGGLYIAGTGRNAATDQAFIAGVFRKLISHKDSICWTQRALDQEARYSRMRRKGYLWLTLLVVICATLFVLGWLAHGREAGRPKEVRQISLPTHASSERITPALMRRGRNPDRKGRAWHSSPSARFAG